MASAMKVESLMTTALVTVRESDSIATADLEMKLGSARHVLVVDDKGNSDGLVSARDVPAGLASGKKRLWGSMARRRRSGRRRRFPPRLTFSSTTSSVVSPSSEVTGT